MKKILATLTLSLFVFGNSYANNNIYEFNKWLFENGLTEYLTIREESEICKAQKKYSNMWYYHKCDQPQYTNNLKIKFYDGWIPEKNAKPNYDTLLYELFRFNERPFKVQGVKTVSYTHLTLPTTPYV